MVGVFVFRMNVSGSAVRRIFALDVNVPGSAVRRIFAFDVNVPGGAVERVFALDVNVPGGAVRRVFLGVIVVAVGAVDVFRFDGRVLRRTATGEGSERGDGEQSRRDAESTARIATRFRDFHNALYLRLNDA